MRRYTLLRLLPLLLVVLALAGLGAWLVPQLRAPVGKTYRFYVEDATGLPVGTEVKFRGLLVGQVTQVVLDTRLSVQQKSPWFEVSFQPDPDGDKLMDLWSFPAVTLGKDTPLIGATVVNLIDGILPGGATPDVLELKKPEGDDVAAELHKATEKIQAVLDNVNGITSSLQKALDSPPENTANPRRTTRLAAMLGSVQDAADNVSKLASEKGSIAVAFDHYGDLATDFLDPEGTFKASFKATLADLTKTSAEARATVARTGHLIDAASPGVERTTDSAAQMMDTLKREPWRIVWKSTKEYNATVTASPSPAPTPKRKRPSSS